MASLLIMLAGPARAQSARSPTVPIPLSVTLSGGVSLGAYQAGALYYLSLLSHQNPGLLPLRLVTGSSAGGINALLSGLSLCEAETQTPADSDFWDSWVAWSGGELIAKGENSDPRAMFSRDPLEKIAKHIHKKWQRGLPPDCDFVIALRATRLLPAEFKVNATLKLARQSEKFALRIRGRGLHQPPLITNYASAPSELPQTLLALTSGDDAQNFEALRDLLFATAAFPVAFAPQKLRTCTTDQTPRWLHADLPLHCNDDEIESAEYVDGGLVDNEPIALAYSLAHDGLSEGPNGRISWQAVPQMREAANPAEQSMLFVNIDLENTSFPATTPKVDTRHVLPLTAALFGNLFNSSRDSEAIGTLMQDPRFGLQIASLRNTFPRMSDALIGFFGFVERDFRAFDFYLGMLEMRDFTRGTLLPSLRKKSAQAALALRSPTLDEVPALDIQRLNCLDAWLNEKTGAQSLCEKMGDSGFFILTKLSRERLKAQTTDINFVFRFLEEQKYQYRDMGLAPTQAGQAPVIIKYEAIDSISHLAALQPAADDFALRAEMPLLIDSIANLPNGRDFHVILGPEASLAMSSLLKEGAPYSFRWTLGLTIENLPGWFAEGGGRVVPTPRIGLEWQPSNWNSSYAQVRLGLSTGYKFGLAEADATCVHGKSDPLDCRGWVVRPDVSLTLVERIRIETAFEIMPTVSAAGKTPIEFSPAIGAQFYF